MDLNLLKSEIQTGPLAGELAPFVLSGNDAEISRRLNDPRFSKNQRVSLRDIVRYLLDQGVWLAIVDKSTDVAASPSKSSARMFTEIQKMGFVESLDMSKPSAQGMLDALIAGSVLTAAHKTAITNMGIVPASRADIAFGSAVTHEQVGKALRNT